MDLRTFLLQNAPWLTTGILLNFVSSFGQTFFISIFAGEIRADFDLSHREWGSIYMQGTMVSALIMVWAGTLTDIFRVRFLAPIILAGLACACFAMALVKEAWLLPFVILALRFFGQGMCSHIASVAMARWFVATRGRALSIAPLGYAVGESLLPLSFVALMSIVDWRTLWIISAAIVLMVIPAFVRLLKAERTPKAVSNETHSDGLLAKSWTRSEVLRHPLFWCYLPSIVGTSAFVTAFFFHQVHLADVKNWTHISLVALFPVYTGVGIIGMLLAGWAVDRFGTGKILAYYQIPLALSFVLLAYAQSLFSAAFALALMAISSGAHTTIPAAFWAEYFGTRHIGSIKALATAAMVFGSAIGPWITGYLIDAEIGIETQMIAIGAFFVLACMLIVWAVAQPANKLPQTP